MNSIMINMIKRYYDIHYEIYIYRIYINPIDLKYNGYQFEVYPMNNHLYIKSRDHATIDLTVVPNMILKLKEKEYSFSYYKSLFLHKDGVFLPDVQNTYKKHNRLCSYEECKNALVYPSFAEHGGTPTGNINLEYIYNTITKLEKISNYSWINK